MTSLIRNENLEQYKIEAGWRDGLNAENIDNDDWRVISIKRDSNAARIFTACVGYDGHDNWEH